MAAKKLSDIETSDFVKLINFLKSFDFPIIKIYDSVFIYTNKNLSIESDLSALFGCKIDVEFMNNKSSIESLLKLVQKPKSKINVLSGKKKKVVFKKGNIQLTFSQPKEKPGFSDLSSPTKIYKNVIIDCLTLQFLNINANKKKPFFLQFFEDELKTVIHNDWLFDIENNRFMSIERACMLKHLPSKAESVFESKEFLSFPAIDYKFAIFEKKLQANKMQYWLETEGVHEGQEIKSIEILKKLVKSLQKKKFPEEKLVKKIKFQSANQLKNLGQLPKKADIDKIYKQWEQHGYSTGVLPEMDGYTRLGYLSPTNFNLLFDMIGLFGKYDSINLLNSKIKHNTGSLYIEADISNLFEGDSADKISFHISDPKSFRRLYFKVLGTKSEDGLLHKINTREPILIFKLDETEQFFFLSTKPKAIWVKEEIQWTDEQELSYSGLGVEEINKRQTKAPFTTLAKFIPPETITRKERKLLKTNNQPVILSVSGNVIHSIQNQNVILNINNKTSGQALSFSSNYFLDLKTDEYQIEIKKEANAYWLVTNFKYKKQKITTHEKLTTLKKGETLPAILPAMTGLLDLSILETRINQNYANYMNAKIQILADLFKIYKSRTEYFRDRVEYIDNFSLYIKERFKQAKSTYYADVRVLRLLDKHEKGDVLNPELKDLAYILKRIAYAPETIQNELLESIDNLDREQVSERIKEEKGKLPPEKADLGIKTKLIKTKKQLTINFEGVTGRIALERLEFIKELLEKASKQELEKVYAKMTGGKKKFN
jgi:hypothetical protein